MIWSFLSFIFLSSKIIGILFLVTGFILFNLSAYSHIVNRVRIRNYYKNQEKVK